LGNSTADTSLWKANYEYGELNADGTVDATKNTGSVAKQTVTLPTTSFVQTYKYDELNRLTEAKETTNGAQNWQQTFAYDKFGNRTGFSQTIGTTQLALNNINNPAIDAATNRFTAGQGYVYDFNGNLIQDAEGRTFTFNGDDKQVQVQDANQTIIGTYFYDGDGARVKKVTNTETTIFVYDGGGALAAEYSTAAPIATPNTSYLTTDNLGSPRVITDKTGAVIARRDFMPFGEEIGVGVGGRTESLKYSYTGSDNIRKRFTGYEKDDETQLDFAEARMYQNKHGRFNSVDPMMASASLTNPQTFNRYSYTGNNPINYTDPSGLNWCQNASGDTMFTGKDTKCKGEYSKDVSGQTMAVKEGEVVGRNGSAGPGSIVVLNADGTIKVLTGANPTEAAQIARVTGTEVHATWDEIIDTAGTTINSAIATFDENLGLTPLPVEHNTAGRVLGDFASLYLGGTLTSAGGTLIAAGAGGELVGFAFDLTGAGTLIGVPVGVVSATAIVAGTVSATVGLTITGNTIVNIYNQSTLEPGSHAGDSIPARGPERDFTRPERDAINKIGNDTGCHTCGTKDPGTKSGDFVPDHQPPNKLNPKGNPQRLYPHCKGCSRKQGGDVRAATRQ